MRLVLLCGLLICTSILSVGQATFSASADSKQVLQGRTVTVEFTVQNGELDGFTPPDFRPFQVVSGPSKSTSMSIMNGRRSSKSSISYTLLTDKVGTHQIPAATVKVGGNALKSKPIKIQVVKSTKKVGDAQQFFVNMEVSDSLVYPGQQVILSYQLYTLVDVNNYNLLNEPDYDGFFAEELKVNRNFDKVIANGEQYYTKSLKKIALFPQQVGTYTFNPVSMTLGIPTGKRRGFFQDVRTESLRTNGLTIQVANLPEGAPESFSGAIGKYRARVSSSKKTITTDDAISINIEVTGNGDHRYVTAPKMTLPNNLELYDPNTIKDEVSVQNGQKVHTKTFEYLIVAQEVGRYEINPAFTYIDTDSNDYVTLLPQKLRFNVLKGTGVANKQVEVETEESIGPISQVTKLRNSSKMFFGTMPYFLLLGFFGMGVAGLYGYRQKLIKSGAFDVMVQRKKQAKLKVIQELDRLLSNASDPKEKTEIISNKFNSYITQKFANTDIQFTDQQVINLLKEQEMPEGLVSQTSNFLSQCQMAIYANVSNESKLYDEVVDIIEKIDTSTSA